MIFLLEEKEIRFATIGIHFDVAWLTECAELVAQESKEAET